ncbi:MAG: hypothetical protein IJO29_01210 [Oscillospiraceae bacterium]|nr:hypothetical protein [Oscillospiraceae bacterium]
MKKITGLILAFCIMLTAMGCNNSTNKKDENSSATTSQTSSSLQSEESSKTEQTDESEQTEESSEQTEENNHTEESSELTEESEQAEENTNEDDPVETETQILNIDRKSVYEYEWSDEYGVALVETEYSSILLGNEDAQRYDALAKALTEECDYYEGIMSEEYDMLTESAEESISLGAQSFSPLVSTLDVHVRRADNTVLSVLYDSYYYNGMNDGSRSFWGANYDTETGNELYLSDVVTDIDELAKVIETELFSTVGADVFYSDTIIEEYFSEYGADGNHWTLEYNGVTVYFGEGEIANSGVGNISVTIEFSEYPELFNEKYTIVPKAYIVGLPMKSTFITDLDNDGDCDELALFDSYDEEFDWKVTLDISTAEVSYVEDIWAYGCEPYYVKTADGNNYLYVLLELETQYELYTYAITNTTINKVGEQTLSPYYSSETSSVLTDPESMHFDIFGDEAVPIGDDFFYVGADGMPVMK